MSRAWPAWEARSRAGRGLRLPDRERPRRFYLVAPSGVPNFGDEFIARSWLDWLARRHPHAEVWLDCIEPGRAAHLFADTHPRLRVTNTLWQLAHDGPLGDVHRDSERARGAVRDLGTPRIDLGLEALRGMDSIHLLGGGYINSLWPLNLAILAAMTEVKRAFGVPIVATGQGLMPQDPVTEHAVAEAFSEFDFVEVRDRASADRFDLELGLDDAFLAFRNDRPVFAEYDSPRVMVLVQGDFVNDLPESDIVRCVEEFVVAHASDGDVGLVEGMPPDDSRLWPALREIFPAAQVFPFMRLWQDGLPARQEQAWLTTRFHFHLLAAAAGARGSALTLSSDYYAIKHGLLEDAGTGWSSVSMAGGACKAAPATRRADFSQRARGEFAARKHRVAARIYG